MNTVDINMLIHTHAARDAVKQNKAMQLVASLNDGVLLWQVACDYITLILNLS